MLSFLRFDVIFNYMQLVVSYALLTVYKRNLVDIYQKVQKLGVRRYTSLEATLTRIMR